MKPGRRFAFTSALASALLALPGTAVADNQTVVQATVYSASGVTHPSLNLSALEGCPTYSGPNPLPFYPSGQDYTVPASSAWALATVLSCGLMVPVSTVGDVWIARAPGVLEAPLAAQDLAVPGPFQDPSAQPLVANNGGAAQNTYFRPWRGGSDSNASDMLTANGPVAIVVAESGQVLQVSVHHHTVGRTSKVHFGATVHSPNGSVVSADSLTWNWSFGDSSSSSAPSPTHVYQAGVYPVTALATDEATGEIGTATIDVQVGPGGNQGPSRRGDKTHSRSRNPNGPERGSGKHAGGPSGHRSTPGSGDARNSHPRATGSTGSSGTSTQRGEAARARGNGVARRTSRSSIKPAVSLERAAPVVSGLLISEVHPLAPSEIQLVHRTPAPPASAPAVRSGTGLSPIPALAGGLCLVLLFGYGAARELRGQRDGTVHGQLT